MAQVLSAPLVLQSRPDKFHQLLIRKGFLQETNSSVSQGLFFNALFLVGGYENNRHVQTDPVHVLLDFQAIHSGHLYIDHQAIHLLRHA